MKGARMQHMVIFRGSDGKPGYQQLDDLDAAIKCVERLSNVDQASDAKVFEMHEVPIEIKTYYRVEVAPRVPATPAASVAPPQVDEEAVPTTGEMTGPTPVSAAGRFGLFGRS
jgi:hypothetical protein